MDLNSEIARPSSSSRKRRIALTTVLLLAVLIGLCVYTWMTQVGAYRESTDNAYVGGHQVQVATRNSGNVIAVYVEEMQRVKKGQLLVELDATDAHIALQQAEAGLAQAVRQVRQWQDTAELSKALTTIRAAELAQVIAELRRRETLFEKKMISGEVVEQIRTKVAIARSQQIAANRQAAADRARVDGISLKQHPAVMSAYAAFEDAWINLQRTRVIAPADGIVAQRVVQPGHEVLSGQTLMRLVPTDGMWVDANFKESQLRNLRIGQTATVNTDVYGNDVSFTGRIVGVSPGTGAVFALLPPQNATGNWVKVIQRVPVRIALEHQAADASSLQLGLSASVSVDTHERNGERLAPLASDHPPEHPLKVLGALEIEAAAAQADAIIARHSGQNGVATR